MWADHVKGVGLSTRDRVVEAKEVGRSREGFTALAFLFHAAAAEATLVFLGCFRLHCSKVIVFVQT